MDPGRRSAGKGAITLLASKASGARLAEGLLERYPGLLRRIITFDDSSDSRSSLASFQAIADSGQGEVHIAPSSKAANEMLLKDPPDLCLVMGWYWLIPKALLQAVPKGFVGVHYSLLPKYRGSSPLVWALINGEHEVGFSIFSFSEGVDDGPIWRQDAIGVGEDDSIGDVLARLDERSNSALMRLIPGILDGSQHPEPQIASRATWCAQRLPEDGRIDWYQPATSVHNFIRAQSRPYPGAYTTLNGRTLRIWKARRHDDVYMGTPGQVARVTQEGVFVIAGYHQAVVVLEVEDESGVARPAHEVLDSIRIRLGR